MCTSNIAGNTQMASLDRQVTQNGLRGYQCNCKSDMSNIKVRLPSEAMMSGGDLDEDTKMMETRP